MSDKMICGAGNVFCGRQTTKGNSMAEPATESDPILFCDMAEFWNSHRCPKCNAKNWTYHSHSQRQYTGFYINSRICRCRSCGVRYWIGMTQDDVEYEFPGGESESFVDQQNGMESPLQT